MNSVSKDLDAIKAETESLKTLIADENWKALELAMDKRQKNLERFFAKPIPDKERLFVLNSIQEILKQDTEYQQLIKTKKNTSTEESLNLKRQYSAAKAYSTVSDE